MKICQRRRIDDESNRQLSLDIWCDAYRKAQKEVVASLLREDDGLEEPKREDFPSGEKWIDALILYRQERQRHLKYELETKPSLIASQAAIRGVTISWKKTRKLVFERDGGICQVCGISLTADIYECGHIVDRVEGGSDRLSNLVAMCVLCNRLKPLHKTRQEYDEWVRNGGVLGDFLEWKVSRL